MLLTSLHSYSPWLLNGGDDTMRIFLLWGCFLPLGRRWSVDAALRNVRDDALASQDPAYAQLLARRRRRDWSPQHESVFSAGTDGGSLVCFFFLLALTPLVDVSVRRVQVESVSALCDGGCA
jgi:hypothetical protein